MLLNNAGIVAGTAETTSTDPNAPNCDNPDCFVSHAFRSQDGVLTDLGVLASANWSHGNSINARGWVAGTSTTGEIDPLNPCGFQPLCPFHAVLALKLSISELWEMVWEAMRDMSTMRAKLSGLLPSIRYLPLPFLVQQRTHSSGRTEWCGTLAP